MTTFISNQQNYRVVLKPGIPSNQLAGKESVPGLYAKFEDGIVQINNEETVELMKKHPRFGQDFIMEGDDGADKFTENKTSSEPPHQITEIDYGHVGKVVGDKAPVQLTKEQKEIIKETAKEMAKEMTKKAIKELISSAKNKKSSKPKVEKEEVVADEVEVEEVEETPEVVDAEIIEDTKKSNENA